MFERYKNKKMFRSTLYFPYHSTIFFYNEKECKEICRNLLDFQWDERLGEKPDGWDDMPEENSFFRALFNKPCKAYYCAKLCETLIDFIIKTDEEQESKRVFWCIFNACANF